MSKNQHPNLAGGTVTTDACGFATIDTGFTTRIDAMTFSFKGAAASINDEDKFVWDDLGAGQASLAVRKATGAIADTAVVVSWIATGF